MAKRTRSNKKAPRRCRECEHWDEISEKVRVRELLENTIEKFEAKIAKADYEPTVAEYMKLLQLGREIGQDDDLKEIKVTWVGPNETLESEK
jgi:hypothetical protein